MHTRRLTALLGAALTLAIGACARNSRLQTESASAVAAPLPRSVAVTVTNDNFADVRVYAVSGAGSAIRIGTVTGLSSATLTASQETFHSGTLRLIASPIGGSGAADSGPLAVFGGESVSFKIQSRLSASYALVR